MKHTCDGRLVEDPAFCSATEMSEKSLKYVPWSRAGSISQKSLLCNPQWLSKKSLLMWQQCPGSCRIALAMHRVSGSITTQQGVYGWGLLLVQNLSSSLHPTGATLRLTSPEKTVLMVFRNFPSILNNKYFDFCIMVSILKALRHGLPCLWAGNS